MAVGHHESQLICDAHLLIGTDVHERLCWGLENRGCSWVSCWLSWPMMRATRRHKLWRRYRRRAVL